MITRCMYDRRSNFLKNEEFLQKKLVELGEPEFEHYTGWAEMSNQYCWLDLGTMPYNEELDWTDYEGQTANDLVDPETGRTILPMDCVPCAGPLPKDEDLRPDPKRFRFAGRTFIAHYYHDGSLLEIEVS